MTYYSNVKLVAPTQLLHFHIQLTSSDQTRFHYLKISFKESMQDTQFI